MQTYFSGFVCDENCEVLRESIPRRFGLAILPDIGISEGSADSAIMRHARKHGYIVITRNETHFERAMQDAPASCNSQDCRCGCGIVTVSAALQRIPFAKITREMKFLEIKIDWVDVFAWNLQVSVRADESFEVTRLPMCHWEIERRGDCCSTCDRIIAALPRP